MKRFLYTASVKSAGGYQMFYVDAETREEADAKLKAEGAADIYASEVDVTDLGKFEFDSETTTSDFGDFPPAAARPSDRLINDVCLCAAEIYQAKDEDAAQAVIDRIRAMLEG